MNLQALGGEGSAKALKVAALTLDVDAKQGDSAVKGQLTTPVSGNLEAKSFRAAQLAANFTVTSPAIPQKTVQVPLNGLVRADIGKERVFGGHRYQVRREQHQGEGRHGPVRRSPPTTSMLSIDRLNVDRYLPPGSRERHRQAAEQAAAKQAGWPGAAD